MKTNKLVSGLLLIGALLLSACAQKASVGMPEVRSTPLSAQEAQALVIFDEARPEETTLVFSLQPFYKDLRVSQFCQALNEFRDERTTDTQLKIRKATEKFISLSWDRMTAAKTLAGEVYYTACIHPPQYPKPNRMPLEELKEEIMAFALMLQIDQVASEQ